MLCYTMFGIATIIIKLYQKNLKNLLYFNIPEIQQQDKRTYTRTTRRPDYTDTIQQMETSH